MTEVGSTDAEAGALITTQLTGVIRLAGSGVRTAPSAVHDLRVTLKRLRAWVRLLRPAVQASVDPKLLDQRFADIGRSLSVARDEQVLSNTLRRLQSRAGGKDVRRIEAWRDQLAASPRAEIPWDRVRAELAVSAQMLHGVDWRAVSPEMLIARLRATYRRARRYGKQTLPERGIDAERLHDLRKLVKRLTYQVEYVDTVFSVRHPLRGGLMRLGQSLGELNDLLVLKSWLRDKGLKPKSQLLKLVGKRIRRRRAVIRGQFDELFRSGSARFVAPYRAARPRLTARPGSTGTVALRVVPATPAP